MIQFSSNTDLFRQKLRLLELCVKNVQLKFITNSIKSFSQNINTETFTTSAFDRFFIVIYNDTWTRTEETVMTEYYWRMIKSVDLFDSAKMVVERHNDEKENLKWLYTLT